MAKTDEHRAEKAHRIEVATNRGVIYGVVRGSAIRKFANPHDAFEGLNADDEVVVKTIVRNDVDAPIPSVVQPAPVAEDDAPAPVVIDNTPAAQ